MPEKNLAIRVDEELFKKVKVRLAQNGMTLKDYIVSLIEKDLQDKIKLQAVPLDSTVSETSLKEAQKILDFVSDIMNNQSKGK
ncbi:MAG: hypothetical protein HFG47_00670 [Lachnospiraceae bacterium]|nr:hypothetical protein [Lachnospiraceae bacterium]